MCLQLLSGLCKLIFKEAFLFSFCVCTGGRCSLNAEMGGWCKLCLKDKDLWTQHKRSFKMNECKVYLIFSKGAKTLKKNMVYLNVCNDLSLLFLTVYCWLIFYIHCPSVVSIMFRLRFINIKFQFTNIVTANALCSFACIRQPHWGLTCLSFCH